MKIKIEGRKKTATKRKEGFGQSFLTFQVIE
jgi:hypothetical protein